MEFSQIYTNSPLIVLCINRNIYVQVHHWKFYILTEISQILHVHHWELYISTEILQICTSSPLRMFRNFTNLYMYVYVYVHFIY